MACKLEEQVAEKRDYYEILGVGKSADENQIKKAYWKLAKKYHPDVNPGDQEAEDKFKEANEAYEVLSDKEKRSRYDQFGHAGVDPNSFSGQGFSHFDLNDIFSSIFGGFEVRRLWRFGSQQTGGAHYEGRIYVTV